MLKASEKQLNGQDYSERGQKDIEDQQYTEYAIAFEKGLCTLEAKLHSIEDPEEIAMGAIIAGSEFYDGDWCGIIEGDLIMEAWCPILWYDIETKGMTKTSFKDMEDTQSLDAWIEALYACKPIIIPDTSIYKEINPVEYEIYHRCNANSVLAVPFWKNPIGFMIVRNPKRFINRSSYLQVLAYVAFSSVTEQKLLNRTRKAFSPEKIKKDTDVMVNLFGRLEVYTSKGVLTEEELNSPKISRFLVYLLLHKGHAAPSWKICEEIWPEEETDNPGSKIKGLAFRLQSAFSIISDYRLVVSVPQGYQINPELNIMTDVQMFDELWIQCQSAMTLQTKIELLKQILKLYRGDLFSTATSEHWLMAHELAYKYKCLGICNELMEAYYETQNYISVQFYAAMALKIEPANLDAYYWMIRAMRQKESAVMAKGELKMAERVLTEDEYQVLLQRLEKARD